MSIRSVLGLGAYTVVAAALIVLGIIVLIDGQPFGWFLLAAGALALAGAGFFVAALAWSRKGHRRAPAGGRDSQL